MHADSVPVHICLNTHATAGHAQDRFKLGIASELKQCGRNPIWVDSSTEADFNIWLHQVGSRLDVPDVRSAIQQSSSKPGVML